MSGPALPPSGPAPGRSPVPERDDTGGTGPGDLSVFVQAALNAWRIQNDPGVEFGSTMAEFVADALASYGWRRVTEDPSKPHQFVVFDMEPDDVVLIGGVRDVESANALHSWAREQWPDRKIVCFADDIDVRLLREFEQS